VASSNPAFSQQLFTGYGHAYDAPRSTVMTVQGAVAKTCLLLAVLSATAIWSWSAAASNDLQPAVLPVAMIGGLVLALITIFKPTLAPWTSPVYAAFQGVVLGALSFLIESGLAGRGLKYPGIALQAVSLTCGTLFVMLFVYGTGLIRVTDRLRAGIVSATGAICLVYLVSMVLSLFGVSVPFLRSATPIGIGIGFVIVGVAAFNLLLDFDMIDRGARSGAPKYLEWYSAFGLLLTLIWLYLEILQLLRQIYGRER
jgi:uncharacterized YccA/Bax inhibitor family protein